MTRTRAEVAMWLGVNYLTPPLTENQRLNRYESARRRVALMDHVHWTARAMRLPTGLARVRIVLTWAVADRRRRDSDNLAPTLKACVDALCRGTSARPGYGLTADDDWTRVESECRIEPGRPPGGMWITIIDLSDTIKEEGDAS